MLHASPHSSSSFQPPTPPPYHVTAPCQIARSCKHESERKRENTSVAEEKPGGGGLEKTCNSVEQEENLKKSRDGCGHETIWEIPVNAKVEMINPP